MDWPRRPREASLGRLGEVGGNVEYATSNRSTGRAANDDSQEAGGASAIRVRAGERLRAREGIGPDPGRGEGVREHRPARDADDHDQSDDRVRGTAAKR